MFLLCLPSYLISMEHLKPRSWPWGFFWPSSASCILLLLLMTVNSSAARARVLGKETDRPALLAVKLEIHDVNGVLNSWNDSLNHCQWLGVTCNTRHQRVTALTLPGKSLSGTISAHIGNLSFMQAIQLGGNDFHGEIPRQFGRLSRLMFLNLSSNSLSGEIPVNLSSCSKLRVISLMTNQLIGKIPAEFGSLAKLGIFYLGKNNLTGEIPSSLGNLSSLNALSFPYNNLQGNLPEELGLLSSLVFLAMGTNKLTGEIPPSLYNISALANFTAPDNFLYGKLPSNLALKLPNLQVLGIAGNQLSGEIPVSISNCTKLGFIDLGDNKLEGEVPTNLGQLLNLQILSLQGNSLVGNSMDFLASLTNCSDLRILSLSQNNFAGVLPNTIGNLSSLTSLYLSGNKIYGTIPMELGNLVSLNILSLSDNNLTGFIPANLGKLQNLAVLVLERNRLSGQSPSALCNITMLYALELSDNKLEGDLTQSFGSCQNLAILFISGNNFSGIISPEIFGSYKSPYQFVLSGNSLSGTLPLEVGKLSNIQTLDVSNNRLSGSIPPTIGDCSVMEYLLMHNNHFSGPIPPTVASLKGIVRLDLSENDLTGPIPTGLNHLVFLINLNLSYNDLEGEVPADGVFGNASLIMLEGNGKLCGGIPQLGFPACPVKRMNKKMKHFKIIIVSLLPCVILISILLLFLILHKRRSDGVKEGSLTVLEKMLRVSYQDLYRATEQFSSANLIGSGSFGSVYKGRLDHHGGIFVAVKVVDVQKTGASKSFKAECKALSNLRHRNLLPLLTYCSSIDFKGQEFKALVYKYMENGNLDAWLHHPPEKPEPTRSRILNLIQRLNIARDVASALDYLHNHSGISVAHCDLKPSNILLDHDLTAHVGDFGLARLLPQLPNTTFQEATTSSSTVAIKGSIGYAAPEYAMGLEVSTPGDVYSFGILLLEMLTGKRPTDDAFTDGLDLHNYVNMALPDRIWEIVDPSLLSREAQQNSKLQAASDDEEILTVEQEKGYLGAEETNFKECLISIFKIGLGCSQTSPKDRMDMKKVTTELHVILRDSFCAC